MDSTYHEDLTLSDEAAVMSTEHGGQIDDSLLGRSPISIHGEVLGLIS